MPKHKQSMSCRIITQQIPKKLRRRASDEPLSSIIKPAETNSSSDAPHISSDNVNPPSLSSSDPSEPPATTPNAVDPRSQPMSTLSRNSTHSDVGASDEDYRSRQHPQRRSFRRNEQGSDRENYYSNQQNDYPYNSTTSGGNGKENDVAGDNTTLTLPEGLKCPPSVTPELLSDRLLKMLLQLPVEQMNEALLEYDEAVTAKASVIRNHQAYLHGVLKRYMNVLEKIKEGGAKPMGTTISNKVKECMDELVLSGYCTETELHQDDRVLSKIKMLSESEAVMAIEELSAVKRSQIRNFGSYFMGILNRYMRGEKRNRETSHSSESGRPSDYQDERYSKGYREKYRESQSHPDEHRRSRSRSRDREYRRNDPESDRDRGPMRRSLEYRRGEGDYSRYPDRDIDYYERDRDRERGSSGDYYDRDYSRDREYGRGRNDRDYYRDRSARDYDYDYRDRDYRDREYRRASPPPRDHDEYYSRDRYGHETDHYERRRSSTSPDRQQGRYHDTSPERSSHDREWGDYHHQHPSESAPQRQEYTRQRSDSFERYQPPRQQLPPPPPPHNLPPPSTSDQQPPLPPPPHSEPLMRHLTATQPPGFQPVPSSQTYIAPDHPSLTRSSAAPDTSRPPPPLFTAPPPSAPPPPAAATASQPPSTDLHGLADLAASAVRLLTNQQQQQPESLPAPPPHSSGMAGGTTVTPSQPPQSFEQRSDVPPSQGGAALGGSAGMNSLASGGSGEDPAHGLSTMVRYAVANLVATGHIDGPTLDANICGMIRQLPESMALNALETFSACDLSRVRSKSGYLAGILRKQIEKVGGVGTGNGGSGYRN